MALSKEQEIKMYDDTIETRTIVNQIEKRLEKGDLTLGDCQERLRILETEHSMLKGKLGAFILGLTFIVSLIINGVLYVWSHLGGKS